MQNFSLFLFIVILYKGEVHCKDINDQRGVFEVKNHFKIHRSFILALRIQVYTVVVYTFWDLSLNLMKTLKELQMSSFYLYCVL